MNIKTILATAAFAGITTVGASAATVTSGVTDATQQSIFCGTSSSKSASDYTANGQNVAVTGSLKVGTDKLGGNFHIISGAGSLQVSSFHEHDTASSQQSGSLRQLGEETSVSSFSGSSL